ncbi:MAG: matrixin family metalloprotease [Halobacteriovoraceae bacterium]|nr:matrixin family metalloprotease [Halobacteriovoraceae bacterium]MCB9095943.1 matrixin family metalloprotease [Halobacteriovoraceae bacterium]
MKGIWGAVLLALLVGCGSKGGGSSSDAVKKAGPGFNIDEKPAEVQFLLPDLLPIKYHIAEDFSEDEVDGIMDVKQSWQAADALGVKFFDKNILIDENIDENDDRAYQDTTVGIYLRRSWENHPSNALAVTIYQKKGLFDDDGKLISSVMFNPDILFNYKDHEFTTDPANVSATDFQSVLVHEMGHLLGLQHVQSTKETVMFPSISPGEILREPQEIDKSHLYHNYKAYQDFSREYGYMVSGNQKGIVTQGTSLPSGFRFGKTENVAIYLMKDGTCVHKVNGKVVKVER